MIHSKTGRGAVIGAILISFSTVAACSDVKSASNPESGGSAAKEGKKAAESAPKPTSGTPVSGTPVSGAQVAPSAPTPLAVSDYTSARLQYSIELKLDANPDKVWELISDHEALPTYLPAIKKVKVIQEGTSTPNGVGAVRSCNLMGNDLVENIRIFEPGKLFGYSVVKGGMPGVADHLGLIRLAPTGDGTKLVWEQYFSSEGDPAPVVAMITPLMVMAGNGLIEKFGGAIVK